MYEREGAGSATDLGTLQIWLSDSGNQSDPSKSSLIIVGF